MGKKELEEIKFFIKNHTTHEKIGLLELIILFEAKIDNVLLSILGLMFNDLVDQKQKQEEAISKEENEDICKIYSQNLSLIEKGFDYIEKMAMNQTARISAKNDLFWINSKSEMTQEQRNYAFKILEAINKTKKGK